MVKIAGELKAQMKSKFMNIRKVVVEAGLEVRKGERILEEKI